MGTQRCRGGLSDSQLQALRQYMSTRYHYQLHGRLQMTLPFISDMQKSLQVGQRGDLKNPRNI